MRGLGAGLIAASVAVVYLWTIAPYGGPDSSARYTFLLLEWLFAGLASLGFVSIVFTFTSSYAERIELSPGGFVLHFRSAITDKPFPSPLTYQWAYLMSSVTLLDYSNFGGTDFANVPFVLELGHMTRGGLSRGAAEELINCATTAGLVERVTPGRRAVVHSLVRPRKWYP